MPSQTDIQHTLQQLADFPVYYEGDYKPLVGLLIRWGASQHEAEDVAQEAMLATFTSWLTIQSPKAFARKAAYRILLRSWKVSEREDCAARRVAQDAIVEAFDANEDLAEYQRMMRVLPHAQRVVFELHHDGYGYAEISEITGQQRETVRSNVRHARQKLVRMMERESPRREATHGP
ncbi:RNA polymerase sigma factor [Micromonospora sp. WMMA1998]|uniref:RNA polymerase sigma factor n=1 Tax=Micromonospora sp. WMMA1998 TaxID=3015167 RepID=UPI00248BBF2C|nr:RNA polymerase sigma factor [Micromonospora sp. WMMA1998]WBC12959.1 RNA polymerase sigma factor [Micromonospora sp. WMMA1998]